ncbi:MAG: hypothetical protein HYX69_05240 [Planctomycetia bacterium]|nr:hypothetical protein [Planctomycetia bacterium]
MDWAVLHPLSKDASQHPYGGVSNRGDVRCQPAAGRQTFKLPVQGFERVARLAEALLHALPDGFIASLVVHVENLAP